MTKLIYCRIEEGESEGMYTGMLHPKDVREAIEKLAYDNNAERYEDLAVVCDVNDLKEELGL